MYKKSMKGSIEMNKYLKANETYSESPESKKPPRNYAEATPRSSTLVEKSNNIIKQRSKK